MSSLTCEPLCKSADLFLALAAHSLNLPNHEDHMGSVSAILRLQRIYELPKEELMRGFVRERFIQPLSIDDAMALAAKAVEQHFYSQAVEWYDVPLRVPVEEEPMLATERIEATLGLINVYLQVQKQRQSVRVREKVEDSETVQAWWR